MEEKTDDEWCVSHRIIHIDLKGAPPKVSYLSKIIPLLRQWGATGILIEYEDMFPYADHLTVLRADHAYTVDDIRTLQEITKAEGMKFIPLLQSFGHLEFVLKKKDFIHLREAPLNPMSLCPTHKESLPLIENIIEQFVTQHNDLEYLHIGGDEVFCMGLCKDCIATKQTHQQLYLSHMVPLINYVQTNYPNLKVFIWDDMFREFSTTNLEMLGSFVIPMVWSYVDDLTGYFPLGMWQRYSDAFDEIWIASSFKGSNGPLSNIPPLQHHINNHMSWIALLDNLDDSIKTKVKGIAITGWARYDHFATLCELIPVALPCLALCLHVFKQKQFTKDLHTHVSKIIGYLNLIPFNNTGTLDVACGNFPGSELIVYVSQIEFAKSQIMAAQNRMEGWMDAWHVEIKKEVNVGHFDYNCTLLSQAIQTYEGIRGQVLECLSFHYYEDTVCEFVKVKIESSLTKALDMLAKIESVKSFQSNNNDNNL